MDAPDTCNTHCSHCKRRTLHRIEDARGQGRRPWRCSRCKRLGMICRAPGCSAMARVEEAPTSAGALRRVRGTVHREFCSAHRGEVPSWEAHDLRLNHLGEWERIRDAPRNRNLCRDATNASAILGTTALFAGAVASGGAIPAAAALIARAGGVGILGTAGTGAGSTASSTAAIALAGSVPLLGAGARLGAAAGPGLTRAAMLALTGGTFLMDFNELIRDVRVFHIHTLRDHPGAGHPETILVNGLLSAATCDPDDWVRGGAVRAPGTVRLLQWDANTVRQSGSGLLGPNLMMLPHKAWIHGWKGAFNRTRKVALMLADLIARTPADQRFVLNGHSLGGRIALLTMAELGRRGERRIAGAHLLGAATAADDRETWALASRSLTRGARIVNAWSVQDAILGRLFRTAEVGTRACGRFPVDSPPAGVVNVDCSDLVTGHTKWKDHVGEVIRRGRQA